MTLKERLGIFYAELIYYWKPFNRKRLMRFYSQFIQKDSLCFDVGANVGNRTNAWYHLGATTIAIEPQPQCIEYMERRFKGLKHRSNITLVPKAVGATIGEATLFISELNPATSTLSDETWRKAIDEDTPFKVNWEKEVTVPVTTLDELISEYGIPDFCKLDVENFEVEVLKGLSQPIPALSVEFYPATPHQAIKCIELLEELGNYEFNWSYGESQVMNEAKWISGETLKAIFQQYKRTDKYGDFYARLLITDN